MRNSTKDFQYLCTSARIEKLEGKGDLQVSISLPQAPHSSWVHGQSAHFTDLETDRRTGQSIPNQQIIVLSKNYFLRWTWTLCLYYSTST